MLHCGTRWRKAAGESVIIAPSSFSVHFSGKAWSSQTPWHFVAAERSNRHLRLRPQGFDSRDVQWISSSTSLMSDPRLGVSPHSMHAPPASVIAEKYGRNENAVHSHHTEGRVRRTERLTPQATDPLDNHPPGELSSLVGVTGLQICIRSTSSRVISSPVRSYSFVVRGDS